MESWVENRKRLRRMIELRMDRRLRSRLDPSDVLQEAYFDVARRISEYEEQERTSAFPFFLWVRSLTLQRLTALHRHHLGSKMRDAGRDVGCEPAPATDSLADGLMGHLTSPSQAFEREERKRVLATILDRMSPTDREVLALRYFEDLSFSEVALVLGIGISGASSRHVRALKRLDEALRAVPNFYGPDE